MLDYLDYDKLAAKRLLMEQYGWEDYGGKHYESVYTKFYQGWILPHQIWIRQATDALVLPRLLRAADSGSGPRRGIRARLSAARIWCNSIRHSWQKSWGISIEEFDAIVALPKKRYSDYPNLQNHWAFGRGLDLVPDSEAQTALGSADPPAWPRALFRGRQAWGALTAAGQFIIIGSLPIYSRVFDPGAYGEYLIFVGAVGIVGVFAGLRYDSAIVLAARRPDCKQALRVGDAHSADCRAIDSVRHAVGAGDLPGPRRLGGSWAESRLRSGCRYGNRRRAALLIELVHTRRRFFFDGVRIIHILSRDGRSAAFTGPG